MFVLCFDEKNMMFVCMVVRERGAELLQTLLFNYLERLPDSSASSSAASPPISSSPLSAASSSASSSSSVPPLLPTSLSAPPRPLWSRALSNLQRLVWLPVSVVKYLFGYSGGGAGGAGGGLMGGMMAGVSASQVALSDR